jgi:hypothetical protein
MNLIGVVGVGGLSLNINGLHKAGKNVFAAKGSVLQGLKQLVNPFGAEGDKGGIGASFLVEVFDNRAESVIEAGARIYAGADGEGSGLAVEAATDVFDVAIVQAGSKASSFAVSGAFAFILDNTTLAHIDRAVESGDRRSPPMTT